MSAVDSTVAAPATAVSTQAVTPESTPEVNTTAGIDTTAAAVSIATGPSATPGTDVPVYNPAEWVLLAAARREIGSDTDESTMPAARTDTAQALDPTAPDAITGVVASVLAAPADAPPISATASASGPDPVIATVGLDIAVSGPLAGIAVSPDGSRVYIASALRGAIQIIDARNGASLGVMQIGPNVPWIGTPALNGIAINADGTRLYVSSANALSVVSTGGGIIATFPTTLGSRVLAASPDGTRVYVGNNSSTAVSIMDTTSGAVLATIPTATDTQRVTVSPDGARAYLLNTATHGYSILDTATNAVIDTVSLGDDITPAGLAVREDGKRIYVTTAGANARLYVLDADSGAVINSIPATGAVVSPDGTRAFAITSSLLTSSTVTVIDTRTGKAINTSEVNLGLTNLTISPDGKRIYALDGFSSKLSILDTDSLANNPQDAIDPLADLRANLTAVYTQAVQAVNNFVAATTDALRAFVDAVANAIGEAQLTVQGLAHDLTERFIDFVTGGVAQAEPTFTSYLYTHLRAVTDHAVNGIATEEVVGPDGIPRMIVYLGGTTWDINNQSVLKNLPSYRGVVDDKQIDAIIAALDGRHREILLVGYSQGGLDAQNIAASGRLGDQVKAVVTFGSPITTPPSEHYKTVHLADINDFIPKVSLLDHAKWYALARNVLAGTPFIGLSTTNFEFHLGGSHIPQETYAQIGIQFDRWTGRQDAKQIINRFQGPIMNVPDF